MLRPKGTQKPRNEGRFASLVWPQTRRGRPNLSDARLPLLIALHTLLRRPRMTVTVVPTPR